MTGKNPGKHGIFSFAARNFGTYERVIANPRNIMSKNLFQIISEQGRKIGAVNVPMSTFQGVDGFMIPGFLDKYEGIPQPTRIRKKIYEKFGVSKFVGDVETDILRRVESEPDIFFNRVEKITERQLEICLYLMETEDWNIFMTVFMGADRIQHFFWKHIDPNHPEYSLNNNSLKFKNYYINLDNMIEKFLEYCEEDVLFFLLSDHGFCPIAKEVILNNYLHEHGFLKLKQGRVDLENSKAVPYGYGDVWLNVVRREPMGFINQGEEYSKLRDDIITNLEEISINGTRPIKEVKKREEVYWGPYLERSPDLVTVFKAGWQAARRPEILPKSESLEYVNDKPRWSGGHDGTHDPLNVLGTLGILGSKIEKKMKLRAYLWDMAPTIIYAMGLHLPQDMDGQVLPIFSD